MKYTLIEMVTRILEAMDSDEVSDVAQTPESLAVANIIKECYFDIVSNLDFPEKQGLFQLDASGDNTKPVLMSLPSNALDLLNLKYNTNEVSDPTWTDVKFVPLDQFLTLTNFDIDDSTVDSMELSINGGTFLFKFRNDKDPMYYTTANDRDILFDSYDTDKETTLQKVKTFCYGGILPTFTLDNSFIPDLDARQFQLLLQEAKAQAFSELKQVQNPTAEKKARKNTVNAQRTKHGIDHRPALQKMQGYGRK